MALVRFLAVALLAAAPLLAAAADAPHEDGIYCSKCHLGHNAEGGSLTTKLGNANLCNSCHVSPTGRYGFPWTIDDQAAAGIGRSHRWDHAFTGGATAPAPGTPMGDHLDAGKMKCSTCHDQHAADLLLDGDPANLGPQRAPITFSSTAVPTAGLGTMTFAAGSPLAGATAKAYRVQIVVGGDLSAAKFRLSNDYGKSWFGCSGVTFLAYDATPPTNGCAVASSVVLNDQANVTVAFDDAAGAFEVGDQWDFYVSYPFLRVSNKDGGMCTTCHEDRHMYWQDVEGGMANGQPGGLKTVSLGTTVFHHPVGQALRVARPGGTLDANGAAQPGDSNATNDLVLGTAGVVSCMTCHHPHNADSNSLSTDPR